MCLFESVLNKHWLSAGGWPTLQYLEILQIGIFCVGVELDSRHGHIVEDTVEDLA
jgi:hypothetical protein